jgi:glycosyltransferase involved in cell wall biosynthesis
MNHSKLTILFIAPLPPPVTGQSLACQELIHDFKARGYDIIVINLSKNCFKQGISSFGRFFEIAMVLLKTFFWGRSSSLVYFTPAESISGNLKDLLILLLLGRRLQRTYLHLHGGAGMRVLLSDRHPFLRFLNAWFLKKVAGVIVLGERHVSIYNSLISSNKIKIVRNFANDDLFVSAHDLANKWSNTEILHVLFLSNLLPGKGYVELLQAIESLPPNIAFRYHFSFAGGFESDFDKQSFFNSIHNLPNVSYHGMVHGAQKLELLRQAHLFCLPTYYPYEGQPISILEAYAAGCAVATTDHSGIFDVFTPGENGWQVVPRSPESLVEMLAMVATHSQEAARIGHANHVAASTSFRRDHHLLALRGSLGLRDA